jgi:hypothetical protein
MQNQNDDEKTKHGMMFLKILNILLINYEYLKLKKKL